LSTPIQRRKRAAVAAAATVAVSSGAAPLVFPAGAAAYNRGDCSPNRLCLYSDGGFQHNLTERAKLADQDYTDNEYSGLIPDPAERRLNDTVSAVWNNTNRWVHLFEHVGQAGNRICFPPATAVRDLHTVQMKPGFVLGGDGPKWGNVISGHHMYSGRPSDCNEGGGTTMVPEHQFGCSM
jgi:hypothetical protein